MPSSDPRVDELRQRLRSLGYLDAGVDRFVLGAANETRGPIAFAARAAIRVGLLGGLLLGPAAALGVGARLPGLISGVRDALVIAVYLGLLFFVAVAVLSFALSAIAAAIVRPRSGSIRAADAAARDSRAGALERLSRAAGFVLTLAALAYLTLWWRNANAGFGWSAPVWTSFALLVAVAISLLLGHAQRITTLAVLAAAAGPHASLPPISTRSWRGVLAGGALAFAGAAVLLVSTAAAESPGAVDHPPLTVVGRGRALRVIAIDGFDPAMFDAFAGDTAAVVATRFSLQPQDTSDPARAWTTVATGEPPEVHGVRGIETRRVAGVQGAVVAGGSAVRQAVGAATDLLRLTRPSIASRDERRSKTAWEVAEDAGLRTAVVNWWATWPAPPGPGIVVTDRGVLRLEHGGPLDAEIAPAELYPLLQERWPAIRQRARDAAGAAVTGIIETAAADVLRRSAELDATIIGMLQALPGPARDLDVIYLPGLDIAQHALLSASGGGASSPSAVSARVAALRKYYAFLRSALESLLRPSPQQDVMLVMQPGRVDTPTPGLLAVYEWPPMFYAPRGIRDEGAARVEDIAPTILLALGIPLSRELAGQPRSLVPPGMKRYVDTYGRPFVAATTRAGKPLDQEMIDRLRSLGYVK
jgi:hypothetical protein